MSGIGYLLWDLWSHPFSSAVIFLSLWIWIKVLFNEWDQRYHFLTYRDCVLKKQYWKFFPVSITNPSIFTLFINVTCLWSLRRIESDFGSSYMLKNTILLLFLEFAFSVLVIQYVLRFLPAPLHHALFLTNIHSGSAVVVAWVTFQAIRYMLFPTILVTWQYFLFAGFLLLPIGLMPLFLLAYHLFFSPRIQHFPILIGVLSGFCLGFGLDNILATEYWTVSFLFDVIVLLVLSLQARSLSSSSQEELYRTYTAQSNHAHDGLLNEDTLILECSERPESAPFSLPSADQSREVEMAPLRRPESSTLLDNLRLPRISGGSRVSADANHAVGTTSAIGANQGDEYDEEAQPLLSSGEGGPKLGERLEQVANAATNRVNHLWRNITNVSAGGRKHKDGYSEVNTVDDDRDVESEPIDSGEERKLNERGRFSASTVRREVIPER